MTEFGWSKNAKRERREEDGGIFAPTEALAQPVCGGRGVATGNLGNVSKGVFETLAEVCVPDSDRIIFMGEFVNSE